MSRRRSQRRRFGRRSGRHIWSRSYFRRHHGNYFAARSFCNGISLRARFSNRRSHRRFVHDRCVDHIFACAVGDGEASRRYNNSCGANCADRICFVCVRRVAATQFANIFRWHNRNCCDHGVEFCDQAVASADQTSRKESQRTDLLVSLESFYSASPVDSGN